jgi:hypothetical protein
VEQEVFIGSLFSLHCNSIPRSWRSRGTRRVGNGNWERRCDSFSVMQLFIYLLSFFSFRFIEFSHSQEWEAGAVMEAVEEMEVSEQFPMISDSINRPRGRRR